MTDYETDQDGLPRSIVGEWALQKHERLRRYVEITRGARSKYIGASSSERYRGGASFIDLFCGPGRARVRETGEIIDGSPLVAFKAAVEGMAPFSEVHLADIKPEFSAAASQRVTDAGGKAFAYSGPAEETAKQVVAKLNPHGLHLAFLDPYSLGDLSFLAISTLATMKHIDFLMHVSVQDMQRNTDRYTAEEARAFDRFAPGWRAKVSMEQNLSSIRAAVLNHWKDLVHGLGFMEIRTADLVRGNRNQRLYWLVFASRHTLGNSLWEKIRRIVSGQGSLDL